VVIDRAHARIHHLEDLLPLKFVFLIKRGKIFSLRKNEGPKKTGLRNKKEVVARARAKLPGTGMGMDPVDFAVLSAAVT
jgi:hypothetical protein